MGGYATDGDVGRVCRGRWGATVSCAGLAGMTAQHRSSQSSALIRRTTCGQRRRPCQLPGSLLAVQLERQNIMSAQEQCRTTQSQRNPLTSDLASAINYVVLRANNFGPGPDFRNFCWDIWCPVAKQVSGNVQGHLLLSGGGQGISPRCILTLGQMSGNSVGNMVPSEEERICGSRSPDPSSPNSPWQNPRDQSLGQNLPGTD